jgi:para-aminobenzoate synthetase component 2
MVEATSEEGEIMAMSHRVHPTYGVQFHPESILTQGGEALFQNFLTLAKAWTAHALV